MKVLIFGLTFYWMKTRYFLLLLSIIVTASCRRDQYRINVSSVNVRIDIKRLEKDLFTIDPSKLPSAVPGLKKEYNGFLQLFSNVINTGNVNDSSFTDGLVNFCTDRMNNEVYARTIKIFPDVNIIQDGLTEAFRHYKFYFPGKIIPGIYTCTTGFNYSIITGDSALGVGLDRYLGADCEYYPRLGIYKYISDRMTPRHIVPDCMYGWADSEWPIDSMRYEKDNVLTEMIHYGKLWYFEKCMLPDVNDELLFGFTPGQIKFCRNNEGQMWQYLVEHNLLFNTEQLTIRKLTGEGPFTGYFTNESPGRAAVWVGFRIVESYMSKNPGVKLRDLMEEKNIQLILEKSKYHP